MSAQTGRSERLWNPDLAPTGPERRTWNLWNIAALWIGMSVCVPTYNLAAGLVTSGMSWWQAVLTILAGNAIVLVPMVLNAHAGTKYGIPFPVFLRAPFGVLGSNVPAILRGLVACGWFGIQTWIGGEAIYALLSIFFETWKTLEPIGGLGINPAQVVCFLAFWTLNVYYILRGIDSIKWLETFSAPLLLAIGLVLLGWGITRGGGLANVLGKSEEFSRASVTASVEGGRATVEVRSFDDRATRVRFATIEKGSKTPKELATEWRPIGKEPHEILVPEGHVVVAQFGDAEGHVSSVLVAKEAAGGVSFWFFVAHLTAMVGFWATLSLNIPDFTRYARSQKDQMLGQVLGLPTTMALYSFIGVAVTCAAVVVFPDILVVEDAPWDPVRLIADRFADSKLVIALSMVALAIATLTTNIAANVVSPANDFSNLAPNRVSFRTGGLITAVIGIVMMPWKLLATAGAYIFTWLIGYGALLGPIGGIMIADYYVVRRTRLAVDDLYRADGAYAYRGGFNLRALAVLAAAILPNVPGFLVQGGFLAADAVPEFLRNLYNYAWFAGFALAFALYVLVAKKPAKGENG